MSKKKSFLPAYLTTVTTFSKLLAAILFIALPFVAFKLGMEYHGALPEVDTCVTQFTSNAARAQVAAAEKAAAQQAAQAEAQPAATAVEPAQPLSYTVDREGNVLTAADTTGDLQAPPAELNQTNGSR